VWTHKSLKTQAASGFLRVTADGLAPQHPDFTAAGTPIEFGFFRGNSNGPGGGSYSIVGAIDNWRVRVNPFCSVAAECDDGDGCTNDACDAGACTETDVGCDDGDACTTDSCTAGACTYMPLDCDDGNDCTRDGCAAGTCEHPVSADFVLVEAKLKTLIGLLRGPACGSETLAKKLVRKLEAKIAKVRAKVARADDATRAAAIAKLLAKADAHLSAADGALDATLARGLVSGPCAATLHGFLDELRQCISGLPRS
jgi:slime mold repeat-containing protein